MLLSALREWDRKIECLCAECGSRDFSLAVQRCNRCIVQCLRNVGHAAECVNVRGRVRVQCVFLLRGTLVALQFEVAPVFSELMITCYSTNGQIMDISHFLRVDFTAAECTNVIAGFLARLHELEADSVI
jgi:hypothetical protein